MATLAFNVLIWYFYLQLWTGILHIVPGVSFFSTFVVDIENVLIVNLKNAASKVAFIRSLFGVEKNIKVMWSALWGPSPDELQTIKFCEILFMSLYVVSVKSSYHKLCGWIVWKLFFYLNALETIKLKCSTLYFNSSQRCI